MTSLQFSANKNAAKYDFKRALKSTIIPAIFTFLVSVYCFVLSPLSFLLINFRSMKNILDIVSIRKNISLCLTVFSADISDFSGENAGLLFLILGALFALVSFRFVMKKRDVNVFFSSSIDRRTMFKNRVAACLLIMAAALLIPIIVDIIINISILTKAGYIIKYGLLIFAECYVYLLTGFSIMLIAMSYCSTIVESIFFYGSIACAPTAVMYFIHSTGAAFLRGYNYADFPNYSDYGFLQPSLFHYTSIINPLMLGKAFGPFYSMDNNLINFGFHSLYMENADANIEVYSNLFQDYEEASFDYILPLIVWAVIGICFILISRRLFINIKAENAGIHGKKPFVSNLFAVEVIILAFALWVNVFYGTIQSAAAKSSANMILTLAVGAFIMLALYFIILSICKRTIKRKVKELTVPVSVIGVTLVISVILITGGFGFSTYVPDAEDISCAIITASDTNFASGEINSEPSEHSYYGEIFNPESLNAIGPFTEKEDLEALTKINEKLVEKTDNMTRNCVCVYYELKNGKVVSRLYDKTDYDAQYSILSLRDSKAAREELTYLFAGNSKQQPMTDKLKNSTIDIDKVLNYELEKNIYTVFQKGKVWIIDSNNIMTYKNIKNTPEFREALLSDLLSQTYEQRFRSKEQAIGGIYITTLNFDKEGNYYYNDYSTSFGTGYYIYPSMTNTVKYLKSTGEYELFAPQSGEIESISINTVKTIRSENSLQDDSLLSHTASLIRSNSPLQDDSFLSHQFISQNETYSEIAEYDEYYTPDEEYEEYNGFYNIKDYFKNAKTFTDSRQIKELLGKSSIYYFSNNDDFIIMIKYKKAGYVTKIIPANEIPKWVAGQKS